MKELRAIHQHQRLPERIQTLDKECAIFGINAERVRQYNKLDDELIESIKAAAKKTVKQRQFGYCRSPALTSAGSNVHLWKSALSTKKYQIPLPASAHELAKLADIPIEVAEAATVSEANTALNRA